jgi:hypothetical protein
MTRYSLHVYRGSAYYPDKDLRSFSRGRLARRARELERQGFHVRLLAIACEHRARSAAATDGKRPQRVVSS